MPPVLPLDRQLCAAVHRPQQDRSDPLIRWRAENGLVRRNSPLGLPRGRVPVLPRLPDADSVQAPPLVDEEPGYGPWLEGEDRRLGQAEKYDAANWNKNI